MDEKILKQMAQTLRNGGKVDQKPLLDACAEAVSNIGMTVTLGRIGKKLIDAQLAKRAEIAAKKAYEEEVRKNTDAILRSISKLSISE